MTVYVSKQNKKLKTKESLLQNIKRHPILYVMVLPVLVYYIIFHFAPMYGVIIAFQRYVPSKGMTGSEFVGFKHFEAFFKDMYFGRLIRNTFLINVFDLLWGFPIPILFALLLNEISSKKFIKITQTITYMPHFISLVVVCGLIFTFTRSTGPIAQLVSFFSGSPPTNVLGEARYFRSIYVISNIWQGFGWGSIIYFAALSGVDPQQYEVADLDGAGRFKKVLFVTLPAISPTIVIMLILRLGQIMSVGFEKIILLYSPVTFETADVISSYVYRRGIVELNYSYGTAINLFNSAINLFLIVIANMISRRVNETSLW